MTEPSTSPCRCRRTARPIRGCGGAMPARICGASLVGALLASPRPGSWSCWAAWCRSAGAGVPTRPGPQAVSLVPVTGQQWEQNRHRSRPSSRMAQQNSRAVPHRATRGREAAREEEARADSRPGGRRGAHARHQRPREHARASPNTTPTSRRRPRPGTRPRSTRTPCPSTPRSTSRPSCRATTPPTRCEAIGEPGRGQGAAAEPVQAAGAEDGDPRRAAAREARAWRAARAASSPTGPGARRSRATRTGCSSQDGEGEAEADAHLGQRRDQRAPEPDPVAVGARPHRGRAGQRPPRGRRRRARAPTSTPASGSTPASSTA